MRKKLRKRAKHQALLWLMLLALLPVRLSATDFVYDGITYTILNEEAKTVETKQGDTDTRDPETGKFFFNAGNHVSGKIVLPSTVYNGDVAYRLIQIGDLSFTNLDDLEEVTVPEGVEIIGGQAFSKCDRLKRVNLPESVDSLGWWVFVDDISLEECEIKGPATELNKGIFQGCTSLKRVLLGNSGIEFIKEDVFLDCSSLETVELPKGLKKLTTNSFNGTTSLKNLTLPDGLEEIYSKYNSSWGEVINSSSGFENSGLTSITIPSSVKEIKGKAFNSPVLKTLVIEDSDEPLIQESALSWDTGECLDSVYIGRSFGWKVARDSKKVKLGDKVRDIPLGAFYNWQISDIALPYGVSTIGEDALKNCTGLTSVIIPSSVTTISEKAFDGCTGLERSAYPSNLTNPFPAGVSIRYTADGPTVEENGYLYNSDRTVLYFAPLHTPAGYEIPTTVTEIGNSAFRSLSELTSIDLPAVEYVGDGAFSYCSNLTSVNLPKAVEIGSEAFRGCSKLPTVNLQKAAEIGNYAFNECTQLATVEIPEAKTIGSQAFKNCANLTSIDMPLVESIADEAFSGCGALASVSLPNSLTTIGSSAFYNCAGFKSIIIPQNVTSVGSKAFDSCSGLVKSAYPSTIANPFTNGTAIAYDVTGNTVVENGFLLSEDKTVLLFAPYTESGECVVPSTVTTIAAQAYKDCTEITSIEIPANVTMIADNAFDGCAALTSVKIADADVALTLGKDIFTGTAVKDIYLGRNWVGGKFTAFTDITIGSQVTAIPDEAFKGCTLLSGITMSDGLESIGVSAFEGCTALTAIEIPSSVTSISKWAFLNCDKLATVKLSENLTSIERALFSGCSSLAAIEIPAKVESIGVYAFANCATLKEIKIPASVAKIDDMAFQGCTAITDFTLEASDTEISFGKDLFTDVNIENLYIGRNWTGSFGFNSTENNLVNLTLGGNVTSIPSGAFKNCAKLTEVTLPETITSIGYEAFKGCKLATVTFNPSDTPIAIDNTAFDGRYITDLTIGRNWTGSFGFNYYNNDLVNLTLGENVTSIPAEAFKNCAKLAEVTLPETVSSIGSSAFYGCGLTSIKIPEAVTSIGSSAFYGCGLTSIKIPAAVTSIGYEAFKGCRLATVIFDPSETPINPNGSFDGQYITDLTIGRNWNGSFGFNSSENNLVNLTLGENVTSIPAEAFKNCAKLAEVTLPEAVASIGSSAFYGCSSLVTINIPEAVTSIGESAFYGCSSLATINIPEAVTSIGISAFYNCSSLTSINIPEAVTSIGGLAFFGCSSLTSVNIESSKGRLEIGPNAFSGRYITDLTIDRNWSGSFGFSTYSSDNNLKNVTFGENVTSIPEEAFKACGKLTSLVIPGSVNNIEGGAFYGCNGLTTVIIEPSETTLVLNKSYFYEALPGNIITDLTIGRNWTGSLGFEGNHSYDIINKLANLTLCGNVTSIPNSAFNYCYKLTAVDIPSSVTSIGNSAFDGCSGLTEVKIPNSVTSIGNEAFNGCSGLNEIVIPNSVTSIGSSTFNGCSGLKEVLIPNSVTSIGESAFSGCSGLKEVVIPNSVTSIGRSAFYGCSGLVKAAYPDNLSNSPFNYGLAIKYPKSNSEIVDNIVWSADHSVIYYAPIGLTDFNIPANVTQVAENAFAKCSGLANLTSDALTAPAMVESSFDGLYDTCRLTVPDESVNNYLENYEWYRFSNMNCAAGDIATLDNGNFRYRTNPATTPDPTAILLGPAKAMTEATILAKVRLDGTMYTVTAIGRDAFKNTALESVTIRNGSIAEIWEGAFENTKLTEVNIPASVKTIGKSAFANNADLTSVTLGSGVETIGDYAFNKTGLTEITVPDAVTEICEYAFADNAALTKATLGSGLLIIGDYAFNKTGLTAITVPDAVTAIGEYAFADNAALTKATLGNGLLTIGDYAFNKTGLTAITVPDAVAAIGDYAFAGNSALTKATLGNGLLTIGDYAFSNTGITEVEIPGNVTKIGNSAFYRNSALESVVLGNSVKTIGHNAFNSTALTSVTIPGSVNSVGYRAFAYNNGLTKVKFAYGEDVINIDSDAFASSPVADLDIDRNFKSSAFRNSSDLSTVAIGNLVSELTAGDFRGSAISSLKIGSSLTAIPDNAFNGCKLTEVIIPSNVTSIGDNAFESNQLTNVIMGCNMETIGENAFAYNDNIATINVTAITPPAATDNVFSTQNARLNVMPEATDDYYNADCWYQFESFGLVPISVIKVLKEDMPAARVAGQPQQLKFTVDVLPANASLQHFFWSTSDPEIATVDNDGVVTIHNKVKGTAEITAHTLYDDVVASVTVTSDGWSSADTIGFDKDGSAGVDRPNDVYNMQGMLLKRDATSADIEALTPGFYIIGGKKVLVK